MEDRFSQQLKKGILEMLVLMLVCREPTYGYALQNQLKELSRGSFLLKEGTLYPILYRLEDDGLIEASWSQGQGELVQPCLLCGLQTTLTEFLLAFPQNSPCEADGR